MARDGEWPSDVSDSWDPGPEREGELFWLLKLKKNTQTLANIISRNLSSCNLPHPPSNIFEFHAYVLKMFYPKQVFRVKYK